MTQPIQDHESIPLYSVVIPAYNEEDYLPGTLDTLADAMAQVPHPGEIVVADNNSSDCTADVARERGARVVFEPENQISRARNCGASAARGQYLIFVDADTRVSGALLCAAIEALQGGQVCGGGAPVASSDPASRTVRLSMTFWNFVARALGWAAGSFVYCHREAWSDIGGFSHELYASEELDFSRRLKRWGRPRGMRFRILSTPVDTSLRKAEWFTARQLLTMMGQYAFMPWRLRQRKHCELWYTRPDAQDEKHNGDTA